MEMRQRRESRITRRRSNQPKKSCPKTERNASLRKVSSILRKNESLRSAEEIAVLASMADEVREVKCRLKRRERTLLRCIETEDDLLILKNKCKKLSQAMQNAKHLVIYTGAGISTAADIPDYRGPNGIWTLLQQGKDIGKHDLTRAQPTLTHMALKELHSKGMLKFVVSQNCDGLHLRSGLPRRALSEVHGNMYIELCRECKPNIHYWRLFDTTERTARYFHKTRRICHFCGGPLTDSIVHFGERGTALWPLNWAGAIHHAKKADVIVCLGSSLKVLKKYPWLWAMDKPVKKRPAIFIVNLQWTPKDDVAELKINGKCDKVMSIIMEHLGLGIPKYNKMKDPIFAHASYLSPRELHTTTKAMLTRGAPKQTETESSADDDTDEDCPLNVLKDKMNDAKEQPVDLSVVRMEICDDIKIDSECDSLDGEYEKLQIEMKTSDTETEKVSIILIKSPNKHNIESKFESDTDSFIKTENHLKTESDNKNGLRKNATAAAKENLLNGSLHTYLKQRGTNSLRNYRKAKGYSADGALDLTVSSDESKMEVTHANPLANRVYPPVPRMQQKPSSKIGISFPADQLEQSIEVLDLSKKNNIAYFNRKHGRLKDVSSEESDSFEDVFTEYQSLAQAIIQHTLIMSRCEVKYAYSGFHSIINPVPFVQYDFQSVFKAINFLNYGQKLLNKGRNNKLRKKPVKVIEKAKKRKIMKPKIRRKPFVDRKEPQCKYCHEQYRVYYCKFYLPHNSDDRFEKYKNNKLVMCLCCEDTESSDDEEDSHQSDSDVPLKCLEVNGVKNDDEKKTDAQPGWFGKGYRKNRRRKR